MGCLDVARFFVEHGTNVAAQDQEGSTPFHLASELGYLELAQLLVEHNTNTEAQNQGESTPLHDGASQRGHLDQARILVEHGANDSSGPGSVDSAPSGIKKVSSQRCMILH